MSRARGICGLIAAGSVVALVATAGFAHAQGGSYPATPPTPGALYRDGQNARYLLGGAWLYRADSGAVGIGRGWWRGAASSSGWSRVTVPNAFNAGDYSQASMAGSVGWYRRDFRLPRRAFASYVPAADRRWIIRFESANYRARVWLNGRPLGSHTGAYLPFEFDLPVRAGVNRLIVRVDDRRAPGDLSPGPSGGWWNFGGLLREVYLRPVERADIAYVRVRTILPCPRCQATIVERAQVRNVTGVAQQVSLRGTYGNLHLDFGSTNLAPHATWSPSAAAVEPHPDLWAPAHPALYRAELTLSDSAGRPIAGYTTFSGIRSLRIKRGHLELNGRALNLRGAFIHEQNIHTGAALAPAELAALVRWERELGSTVIRSHYPLDPEILELADRYGLLVWSEIPVYQLDERQLAARVRARAYAVLAQNILNNQNHPSVMLWSIGNELQTPAGVNQAAYIRGAVALAHRLDPTRPVGMAVSDWPGVACQASYGPLDALGFNDYFGWTDAGGGTTDDRDVLGAFLDSFRACYPGKAIFISEFGFEANRHGPVEERGTYEFQANSLAYQLGVFASKRWLSGAIYFALQDFAVRPGWGGGDPWPNPPWDQKGLVDPEGGTKPGFSVLSAIYHATIQVARAR